VRELQGAARLDRPHEAEPREPGRRRGARQPAALFGVDRREIPQLVLGPARLHGAHGQRALLAACARVRALAAASARRDEPSRSAAAALRADAREPRAGSRAVDQCRNCGQAESRRAEPDR
jgi:hypothetical protein